MKLTRKQVALKYDVGVVTVRNWSNGYYYRLDKKVWYFPDHKHLEFTRSELGQPFFEEEDVNRWIFLLNSRRLS